MMPEPKPEMPMQMLAMHAEKQYSPRAGVTPPIATQRRRGDRAVVTPAPGRGVPVAVNAWLDDTRTGDLRSRVGCGTYSPACAHRPAVTRISSQSSRLSKKCASGGMGGGRGRAGLPSLECHYRLPRDS